MAFAYVREGVAVVWVLTLFMVGLAIGITSVSGWMTLTAVALISLVILQRLWRAPEQTLSESINKARR
jgi:ABC-type nickel/cobalt efflux system permease component RcnA